MMPKVSVVIPVYNAKTFIGIAIESVLNQTFRDFEVIVVNDGSTDDTAETVQSYGERIHYVFQENRGQSAARNQGIRTAQGEYVAFLDADDVWYPDKLQTQIDFMERNEALGMVGCYLDLIDERGTKLPGCKPKEEPAEDFASMFSKGTALPSSVLIRSSCLKNVGYFNEHLPGMEDFEFFMRIAKKFPVAFTKETLGAYRVWPGNFTRVCQDQIHLGYVKVGEWAVRQGLTGSVRHHIREKMSKHYYFLARDSFFQKDYQKALLFSSRSLLNNLIVGRLFFEKPDSPFSKFLKLTKPYLLLVVSVLLWPFGEKSIEKSKGKIVIAESGSGYGGSAKYLESLSPFLRKHYSVEIVAYGEGPFLTRIGKSGWKVRFYPSWRFVDGGDDGKSKRGWNGAWRSRLIGFLQLIRLVPWIALWLRVRRVRLVHLNNEILSHLPLLMAAHLSGCRILCHFHGWRVLTRTERWVSRLVDQFVSVTYAGAKFYEAQLPGRKVTGVPNGMVWNGQYHCDESIQENARQELGIQFDEVVVSIIGRLVPMKGHSIFLRALSKVASDFFRLRAFIVGNDPEPDHRYRRELERFVDRSNIQNRVQFLPWQENVTLIYAASDIVIQPSTEPEAFGLVALEAMAFGKPVVASRIGGLTDLVRDGETGLLVEPGDIEGLASAIRRLVTDKNFAKRLGEAGKKYVRSSFTMEQNASYIKEIYESMLGGYRKFQEV